MRSTHKRLLGRQEGGSGGREAASEGRCAARIGSGPTAAAALRQSGRDEALRKPCLRCTQAGTDRQLRMAAPPPSSGDAAVLALPHICRQARGCVAATGRAQG